MPGPSPRFDASSFRQEARDRAFARLVWFRLLVVPVLGVVAFSFALFEPTPWRRVVLATVVVVLGLLSVVEWLRYTRRGLGVVQVPFNVAAVAAGQLAFVLATGGLFSPVVPALIMVAGIGAILIERRTMLLIVALVHLPALWAMAYVHATGHPVDSLVPALFGDAGTLEHGVLPWLAATAYTGMLVVATRIGLLVRTLFEDLFDEGMRERDERLALHAEQSRALTALSGEIAHELKNPLASVKGLSALVAKDLEGKSAERMSVLRREVDRMQDTLEELLDFSRPLVPLAMEDVELGALSREVARLHEGSAAERSIAIVVSAGAPVRVRCDPRKVRQVLINLVQNALDASPPGDRVEIAVGGTGDGVGDGARLEVRDRGPGVDAELGDRVFEAGVTTKEHGSGIGLVVARSVARQHGGDLVLSAREGGGCVAELTLPAAPATTGQSA
jgi:signal transduction histidine kinase